MVIFDYKPNGYGPDEYFLYSGDLVSLKKYPSDQRQRTVVNGWLVTTRVFWLQTLRFVFFGRNNEIFLHSREGVFNCSSGDTKITQKRFLNVTFVKVYVLGVLKARCVVYTPIVRLLANDGMFPSEAEPLLDILANLADPTEHRRLAKVLSAGIELPSEGV